jgi:hypothetical protein
MSPISGTLNPPGFESRRRTVERAFVEKPQEREPLTPAKRKPITRFDRQHLRAIRLYRIPQRTCR